MIHRAPRSVILCLLCIALAACDYELDLFGPGAGFGGGGGYAGPPPNPELMVFGEIFVDGYPPVWDEAFVTVYEPQDTLTPITLTFPVEDNGRLVTRSVTRVPVSWRGYELSFGSSPDPTVCTYLLRVILWNGTRSELQPLVPDPPLACTAAHAPFQGSSFEVAGYGGEEEYYVEGTVFVDGSLAGQGRAGVDVNVRRRGAEPPAFVATEADGTFRVALDGPQWFVLCRSGIGARFRAGDYEQIINVTGLPDMESCGIGRRLPDVRLGQTLAAEGVIRVDGAPVAEGEGWARLLDPADATLVGDTVWTQDNGAYRLYFPLDLEEPGCDWLIEGGSIGGPSERRPYQRFDYCVSREWHEFELTSG